MRSLEPELTGGCRNLRGPRSTLEQLPAHKTLAQDHIKRNGIRQDRPDTQSSIFRQPVQRHKVSMSGYDSEGWNCLPDTEFPWIADSIPY